MQIASSGKSLASRMRSNYLTGGKGAVGKKQLGFVESEETKGTKLDNKRVRNETFTFTRPANWDEEAFKAKYNAYEPESDSDSD